MSERTFVIRFGEMPEWSIGAVSKTVIPSGIQGSNPCLSAKEQNQLLGFDIIEALCFYANRTNLFVGGLHKNTKAPLELTTDFVGL